jgi:Right handed beta helix region/Secretion system C-terminal sorting domain
MMKKSTKLMKLLCTIICVCDMYMANATVHYVKTTSAGTANGSNWANASADLQAMINTANAGDSIWVASGTYKPTTDLFGNATPTSNRFKAFALKDGVQLFGGFAGTETDFTERQIATNITTLSGDINGDDIVVPVANTVYANNTNISDNAYHITMYAKGASAGLGVTIDGFTFTGAAADVAIFQFYNNNIIQADKGGAISLYEGTHIIRNNNFIHNTTSTFASAIFLIQTSNVLIENNSFTQNNSEFGAVNSSVDTSLIMNGNTFTANTGINGPGVLSGDGSSIGMMDNIFVQNKGAIGALQLAECTVSGQNNVFIKNQGTQGVGAVQTSGGASSFYFTHCTFFNNTSTTSVKTFSANFDAYTTLTNCIIQGSGQQLSKCSNCVLDISASIISGGDATCVSCPNTNGNIYAQFADTTNFIGADNAWRTADDGLNVLITSPANSISIYNGYTNTQDIKGTTRPLGNGSIGAYQYVCSVQKVFVKASASGNNSGTSWANAFTDFQSALNSCADTIWVAAGTYKPSVDANGIVPADPRNKTFYIPTGRKIYGGFIGTENTLAQRNIYTNITTLSADINNDDVVTGNRGNQLIFTGNTENNYHTVVIVAPALNAVQIIVDGFVIKAGKAAISSSTFTTPNGVISNNKGAGIYIKNGDNLIENCNIIGGTASKGGGVYLEDGNTYFLHDSLLRNLADEGGAMYKLNASINLKKCTMFANAASYGSGGNLKDGTNTIDSCYFKSNADAVEGGALFLENGDQYITNNYFEDNAGTGGAIFTINTGTFIEKNIFKENYTPDNGAALHLNGGGIHNINQNFFLSNYAVTSGGGIYLAPNTTNAYITSNVFASNYGALSGAGINLSASVNAQLINNTFYDNDGYYQNAGFYAAPSSIIKYANNIFWRNRVGSNTTVAQFQDNSTNSTDTNNMANNSVAPLNTDPNFINQADINGADNIYFTADDGLNVLSTSVAIGAGVAGSSGFDIPYKDIIGTILNFYAPTIGAYEFNIPTFIITGTAGILECNTDTTHVIFTIANAIGTVTITPSATGLAAGIYTFTATDANSISATTVVEIIAAPAFSVTPIQTQYQSCFGDSITLSATISPNITNVNYIWFSDNYSVFHNQGFNYLDYDTFTVIATNNKGTCIDSAVLNTVYAQNLNLVLSGTSSITSYATGYGAAAVNVPTPDGAMVTYKNQFAITYCDVIATVQDAVGGNVLGNVSAASIIKTDSVITANNLHYVKRPVQITPTNNGSAIVTLYFTQFELAQYNEYVNNNSASNQAFSISNLFNYSANDGDSFAANITKVQGNAIDSGGTINAVIPVSLKYNGNWGLWTCTFPVSSFSYFYLSGVTNNVPLSVNEINLQAYINGNADELNYQIQNGSTYDKLELQHSTDGNIFTTINSLPTLGKTQFSFTNSQTNTTNNYYKIKGTTIINEIVYSKITNTNRVKNNTIAIYPNPIKNSGVIEINAIKNTVTTIKIYNTYGAVVYTINTELHQGNNLITLPLQSIASGVYNVQVSFGTSIKMNTSFIKE